MESLSFVTRNHEFLSVDVLDIVCQIGSSADNSILCNWSAVSCCTLFPLIIPLSYIRTISMSSTTTNPFSENEERWLRIQALNSNDFEVKSLKEGCSRDLRILESISLPYTHFFISLVLGRSSWYWQASQNLVSLIRHVFVFICFPWSADEGAICRGKKMRGRDSCMVKLRDWSWEECLEVVILWAERKADVGSLAESGKTQWS